MQARPITTWSPAEEAPVTVASPARRANRRRVMVFLTSVAILLAVSLTYVFTRPPEYRTAARLQITPATLPTGVSKDGMPGSLESEVQVLTSRPVLEPVVERLSDAGYSLA